jgi:hypothetical protein
MHKLAVLLMIGLAAALVTPLAMRATSGAVACGGEHPKPNNPEAQKPKPKPNTPSRPKPRPPAA